MTRSSCKVFDPTEQDSLLDRLRPETPSKIQGPEPKCRGAHDGALEEAIIYQQCEPCAFHTLVCCQDRTDIDDVRSSIGTKVLAPDPRSFAKDRYHGTTIRE